MASGAFGSPHDPSEVAVIKGIATRRAYGSATAFENLIAGDGKSRRVDYLTRGTFYERTFSFIHAFMFGDVSNSSGWLPELVYCPFFRRKRLYLVSGTKSPTFRDSTVTIAGEIVGWRWLETAKVTDLGK